MSIKWNSRDPSPFVQKQLWQNTSEKLNNFQNILKYYWSFHRLSIYDSPIISGCNYRLVTSIFE